MILEVHSPNPETIGPDPMADVLWKSTSKASRGRTKAAHRRRTAKCEVRNMCFYRGKRSQLPWRKKMGWFLKNWLVVSKKVWNFQPENWGRWSNLTSIFFRWVGSTTNRFCFLVKNGRRWEQFFFKHLYLSIFFPCFIRLLTTKSCYTFHYIQKFFSMIYIWLTFLHTIKDIFWAFRYFITHFQCHFTMDKLQQPVWYDFFGWKLQWKKSEISTWGEIRSWELAYYSHLDVPGS